MPLPTPGEKSEKDFIQSCMSSEQMLKDFPDEKQRAAVCYKQYRNSEFKETSKKLNSFVKKINSETEARKATEGSTAYGAGAKRREKLSPEDRKKAVMMEFEKGTLHSSDGKIVKDRKQALAIAMSESKK